MTSLTVDLIDETDLTNILGNFDDTATTPPSNALQVGIRYDLNDPGSGTLFVHKSHPLFNDVRLRRFLQWNLDGTPVFWSMIETIDHVTVGPEAEQGKLCDGRGVLAYLERATVRSRLGLGAIPVLRDRPFNWTAIEFVDTAAPWTTATQIVQQSAANPAGLWGGGIDGITYPDLTLTTSSSVAWHDTTAYWIGDTGDDEFNASLGVRYFRTDNSLAAFLPPAQGFYLIEVAASFYGSVWLDGTLLFETHTGGNFVVVELSPVTHTLAIANAVITASVDAPNHVGGVIYSVLPCDENGTVAMAATPLIHSDNTTLINAYPASQPAMTPGHPFFSLLGEAQLRVTSGKETLPLIVLNFDLNDDSNGNPWTEIVLMFTKTHTDYLTFGKEMVANQLLDLEAYIDTGTGAIALNAFPWGQLGTASGVTYASTSDPSTSNLDYASFRSRAVPNVLHVDWPGPDFEVADATKVTAANERIESFLSLGAQHIPDAALEAATAELANFSDDSVQVKLRVKPVGGDVPLLDVKLGDTAIIPTEAGGTQATRHVGGDIRREASGYVRFGPEFGDQMFGGQDVFEHSTIVIMESDH